MDSNHTFSSSSLARRQIFSLCMLVALASLYARPSHCEAEEPAKLRVGIIAPLSGAIAVWGKSVQTAIELANSLSPTPAELFFADEEGCVPTKALSAFHALTTQRKIDLLVTSCLGGTRAIAPLAKARGLPLYISGRSSSELQREHPNALSWLSLLDSEGKELAALVRQRGWSRGAAIVSSDYFGAQFLAGIQAGIRELGSSFSLASQDYSLEGAPIGPEFFALLRSKPQVIFLMLSDQAAAFIVKQLRTMQFNGDIVLQSSMLHTDDPATRAPFAGALQQKFIFNDQRFTQLKQQITERIGQEVADDFVFSFDGFSNLLSEAHTCRDVRDLPLEACMTQRMRNEQWRQGASGSYRFMKDGSTERPMVVNAIVTCKSPCQ
jgi:ABC-type branched-subunit amino acid transport system substrate-binding protein